MTATPLATISTTSTVLVDGPAVLAFAYRSVAPTGSTTATGQPTNAVAGFLTTVFELIDAEHPSHVAVVLDGPGTSRRTQQLPTYRPQTVSPDLASQQQILRELLHMLNVAVLEAPTGYESADLIATLASTTPGPVLILSPDERILQCVTETTTLARPQSGRAAPERLSANHVQDRHALGGADFVDYLALRGDKARGLLPIPGVGERTARTWLAETGTLDALLTQDRPRRGGLDVRDHATTLLTYRQVLRLNTALARPDSSDFRLLAPTTPRTDVLQRFDELALPELGATALTVLAGPNPESPKVHDIPVDELGSWLTEHAAGIGRHSLALYIAPTGPTAAITAPTGTTGLIDLAHATETDRNAFAVWLSDTTVIKAVHDLKSTIHTLRPQGWTIAGVQIDTALAAYLLAPNTADYTLSAVANHYLDGVDTTELSTADTLPTTTVGPPAALAAQVTARLADNLLAELAHRGMAALAATIEQPVAVVLADIEHRGIAVDTAHLRALRAEFTAAAAAATAAATEILGRPINLGSTAQLQQALFTDLDLPRTRKIRSGHSTAADELAKLLDTTGHPFITRVLDHRGAAKLAAIIDSLSKHIATDGRIHTTLSQTTVETGRLSSLAPNLQNIPIRTIAGRRIREAFIPGTGFDYLLAADYSQIEMRIMAHASGDQHLIEAFTRGEDMHRFTASLAFNIPLDQVTETQRTRAKAISYGLAYGQRVRGLATELNIPLTEARAHYVAYFARFGAVRDYLDATVEEARRTGYTETLFGRRRYLPDLNSDNPRAADAAERAALNAPIQGTAADIIKISMTTVDTAIRSAGLRARMILQIHDELLFEVPADEVDKLSELVREVMPSAANFAVPLDVTVGVGRTWAAAHGGS